MQGKQASNEGISTPRRYHVAVEESTESPPKHGTKLQGLDPEVEGKDEKENGDGLVVVRAGNRSRDIAGGDAHESRRQQTSRRRGGHLIGEKVCGEGRKSRTGWRKHDA